MTWLFLSWLLQAPFPWRNYALMNGVLIEILTSFFGLKKLLGCFPLVQVDYG